MQIISYFSKHEMSEKTLDFKFNSVKTSVWICLEKLLWTFYESLLHTYHPHFLDKIFFAPKVLVFFVQLNTQIQKAEVFLTCWFCNISTLFPYNERKIIMLITCTNKSNDDIDSKLTVRKHWIYMQKAIIVDFRVK